MPDPVTTLGAGALAAYLGKDGLQKLLGPTADYLGKGLANFTQQRIENVARIFQSAEKKLGEKLNAPGQVPPKVLKSVLDDGSFTNDLLTCDYLGGILASSRTEVGRDDRGARIGKIVDGLSVYQIRTHYLIYSTIKHIFAGKNLSLNMHDREKMRIFLPYESFFGAMEFNWQELQQLGPLLNHAFFGLHSEALIEGQMQYGQKQHLTSLFPAVPSDGIICQPSALGAELFLWGFGHGDKPSEFIFDDAFKCEIEAVPEFVINAVSANFS